MTTLHDWGLLMTRRPPGALLFGRATGVGIPKIFGRQGDPYTVRAFNSLCISGGPDQRAVNRGAPIAGLSAQYIRTSGG